VKKNKIPLGDAEASFFLVGSVRSGTTLLRLILGNHPDIARCDEMEYVTPAIVEHGGIPDDISGYKEFLSTEKGFWLSNYSVLDSESFVEVVRDFFKQLKKTDNKPILGAVVHKHFEKLPLIWPNAKYIFMVRDPRDVARSCVKMGWGGSAWGGSEFWARAYESWLELSKKISDDMKIEIAYEDLISEPVETIKKLCDFLGVKYTPSMFEIDGHTTYVKPDAKQARSWRNSATNDEIAQVEARVGEFLEDSGYKPSGLPPLRLNLYNKMRISIQGILNRSIFRIKRYGLPLSLAQVITNRFSLGSFNKKVKIRTHNINIKYHK
jgi:hypothetical protein